MPQIAHKGAQWPSLLIIVTQSTVVLHTQLLSKSIFSKWQLLSICPCLKALFELAYFITSNFFKLTEDRLPQPPTYYSLFELNKGKFSNCITYNQLFHSIKILHAKQKLFYLANTTLIYLITLVDLTWPKGRRQLQFTCQIEQQCFVAGVEPS